MPIVITTMDDGSELLKEITDELEEIGVFIIDGEKYRWKVVRDERYIQLLPEEVNDKDVRNEIKLYWELKTPYLKLEFRDFSLYSRSDPSSYDSFLMYYDQLTSLLLRKHHEKIRNLELKAQFYDIHRHAGRL